MRVLALLTALLLVASGGAAAAAAVSVGVAPFAQVAPSGEVVPDVATRLAEWLAANGVQKVVGPAELGGPAIGDPSPAQVGTWSRKAGVAAVVAGRTTRIGQALSVDARVLEGATGAALGTPIVIEVERPQDFGKAIQSLTAQVAARLQGGAAGNASAVAPAAEPPSAPVAGTTAHPQAASPPAAPVAAKPGAPGSNGSAGTKPPAPPAVGSAPAPQAPSATPAKESATPAHGGPFDSKKPISIQADQLEATEHSQAKHLVFTGSVSASQGDLTLRSDRLEAFYPPGGSSPDRLEATGHVVVSEPGRKARCDKAVYLRKESRVVCTGKAAELTQDCDRVAGKTIIFHLDTNVLQVDGRADVHLQSGAPSTTCTPPATGEMPTAGDTAEAGP